MWCRLWHRGVLRDVGNLARPSHQTQLSLTVLQVRPQARGGGEPTRSSGPPEVMGVFGERVAVLLWDFIFVLLEVDQGGSVPVPCPVPYESNVHSRPCNASAHVLGWCPVPGHPR